MRFGTITMADSLWRLIDLRHQESECLRILWEGLVNYPTYDRNDLLVTSRLLHPKLPGNYFSFREKQGMISYLPIGRVQAVNPDGTWKREGRQAMKPGRWVRAMINPQLYPKLGDESFAEFNAIVRHEELRHKLTFMQIPVKEAYKSRNCVPEVRSCMSDAPVGEFYEAFGCEALVAAGTNGLWKGRAIIWNNVSIDGGSLTNTFMDRVYADSVEAVVAFTEHARNSGWYHKANQDRLQGPIINPGFNGMSPILRVKTDVELRDIKFYPYLDTFAWGGDDFVSNSDTGAKYTYQNTDGGRGGDHPGQVQDADGNWIDEDSAIRVGDYYYSPDSYDIVHCERSEEYILREHSYYVNHHGGFYISGRFICRGEDR